MKKEIQQLERRGLPGGPNEMFTYTTGVFSTEGFRMDSPDVNNYQNIIPSGSISMKERDGSPLRKGPIHGIDNLGYEQVMYPGFDYQFPGTEVTETLIAKMGGALLDKTIKCGNCGWEWKAADGGSDLYNCHKCKGGKGLIKAQGGTETKPKLGAGKYYTTTGKIVDWGTPEYEAAYNRGEVLSEDGIPSEVTLQGGTLPEVVINNNYKNNFWENYRDKIVEENKDAGLLGAIIGTPLSAVTSLPQLAATYAVTGKVQRPSEAMDIQNPYGAMAVDAIADPSNWIGAGELTALGRLTKEQALAKLAKIPRGIAPELREGLRTNGLTFNGTPRKYPINNYQRAATEDVNKLFEEFPELAKIGSKEDYIKHLETIHPETTQPGIFYRGSNNPNLNASEWTPNPGGGNNLGEGFYFTPDPFKAEKYGKEAKALLNIKDPTYTSVKLNMNGFSVPKGMTTKDLVGEGSAAISIENPNRDLFTELGNLSEGYMRKYTGDLDEQGFPVATRPYETHPDYIDYSKIDEIAVPNNSQIHVLGSDADKELFKNYINNNKKRIAPYDPLQPLGDNALNNKDRIVHTLDDVEFTPQDEIQELHNNLLSRFNTEEGKRRLALLGIDNTKLNPAELSFNNTGSGYFPTDNTMDIDLQEAIQLGIDPSTVYAHETGHWLGKQYGDQSATLMDEDFYDTPMDQEFIASYPENLADELLAKNPNVDFGKISKETSAAYMLRNKDEAFPFLREMRQNMLNKGYINDEYDDISQETIDRFIKENPDDRISSFTEPNSKQSKTIYELFKNLPTVVPGAIGLGTVGLMQEEDGGEPSTQTTTTPSPLVEYVVKKGDTLSKIAAANNTSVRSIMKNNESIADPNVISINQKINLATQIPNAPVEEVYKDWNTIRDKKDKINKLSDEQKIVSFHNDKPEESYLIVDKKNAVMKLYTGGNLTKSFEVGVGQNPGDAQTVTKVKDGKTDWSAGNKSTGAGIYTISNINPASEEYYNEPAFNLKNENGIEVSTTIHGTPKPRRIKFNNGTVVDNRMSNGCINGKCEDLKELYGQLDVNTKVYILPEDVGNNFQIVDGKPALRVSSQNRQKYNTYVDQTGATQKGQGANQTTNTLVYKPIKATLDEAKFKNNVFQWNDFNDEKEYASTTKPFIAALTTGKKDVMKAAKISSDVYNELAKMSFGIYGTESNFGDTHSAVGNLARATNKLLDSKSSSSPDYKSKASTYGADENYRSVGLTQLRWNYLNADEKKALKEVGITSNKDFLNPKKAAIGTVTVLGVRYNQQLNDKQKQDVWKYLPTKWNNRANYSDRVKSNSSYLSFKQLDKKQEGGESKPGPLMKAYNRLPKQKKMGGAIANKKQFGGQLNSGNINMYRDYIKGTIGNEIEAIKNYDKLNRIYYTKAKESGMTVANYIMTYIANNS
jgi:LysM repeat protein